MATVSTTPAAEIDDEILYEVVDGEIVEIPPMGTLENLIASLIDRQLQCNVAVNGQGWVVPEMLFDFTKAIGRKRRPDLAFVSYDRWPRDLLPARGDGWEVVPNLAIEVVSPSNTFDDVFEKLGEYFQVGVERVWAVFPNYKQVYVYTSPSDVNILTTRDALTDEALFPGLRISLGELFGAK